MFGIKTVFSNRNEGRNTIRHDTIVAEANTNLQENTIRNDTIVAEANTNLHETKPNTSLETGIYTKYKPLSTIRNDTIYATRDTIRYETFPIAISETRSTRRGHGTFLPKLRTRRPLLQKNGETNTSQARCNHQCAADEHRIRRIG